MSRASHEKELILGGEPRVNLLPPEVAEQARDRLLRRKLLLATAGTVLLVLLGIGGAGLYTTNSTSKLADAQAETANLLAEQSQYVAVRQVQAQVDTAHAARAVGGWADIDWKAYLQGVRAALPADVGIDAVTVDSTSPLTVYPQPTAPLQNARVATLTVTLASPGLPTVPQWLEQLQGLPGMADVAAGAITTGETPGYTVVVTMHINADAFSGRFLDTTGSE
jgi:Tfp pilus assembly protein PilN